MSNSVIKVENVSKQYRLGQVGTGSIMHDLNRWWHQIRGNEDPYLKIGETNDRSTKGDSEYVWSLKDINFSIEKGDAVGIIGRNGAGKSTLLKILSRTTAPTTGNIKIKGRVASLLEVGTGFHPELSGRENVFLNGAILGMTKSEIKRKFDEIVDFSGVERYIDTPVKRYSSGMYVRLAFAVAAHLESEILIVDEVLAVGDSEFQKKCLGKMGDISRGEGRTVLFVSHNMVAIQNLCNKGIVLKNGEIEFNGLADNAISQYNNLIYDLVEKLPIKDRKDREGDKSVIIKALKINGVGAEKILKNACSEQLKISIEFQRNQELLNGKLLIGIYDQNSMRVIFIDSEAEGISISKIETETFNIDINFPSDISLGIGRYSMNIAFLNKSQMADYIQEAAIFEIAEADFYNTGKSIPTDTKIITKNEWKIYE